MRFRLIALGLLTVLPLAGCSGAGERPTRISAGGATFVNPLMQKWAGEYRGATGVEIDYVAKGSGYGVEQMTARTIDFGCSDAPMKKDQLAAAREKGGEVVHVPLVMGAVAVVYNLHELRGRQLRLTGEAVADIYRRNLTRWDDPRIAALNPGVSLPGKDIVVVARAEASGTTNIFTEYLAQSSTAFKAEVGSGTKPKWPQGVTGQEQNDGVAGFVKDNAGTVGYVEVLFAKKNDLATALLRNKAGEWVGPEADAVTAAAEEAVKERPTAEPYSLHELTYPLTDAAGAKSYPVCGISYAVLYAKQPRDKGPAVVAFLRWAVTDGQKFARGLEYAPLPAALRERAADRLGQITFE